MRRLLEELMDIGAVLAQTTKGRELIAQGEARGREIGEALGLAEAIVSFSEARGVPLSDSGRERILGCGDVPTLRRWVARAATAASADEVLD